MAEKVESTEEGQEAVAAKDQEGADASITPGKEEDTGMVGVQADREMAAVDTSQDTPVEAIETPLFDEVAPSAEDLGFVDEEGALLEEEQEEPVEEGESEEAKADEETPAEEVSEEETPAEEKSEAEEAKSDKPPPGYVPHAALHEERMLRQKLTEEVGGLREELSALKAKVETPEEDSFKILSDQEFDELAEDDPAEAVKYERRLNKYLREEAAKESKSKDEQDQYYKDQALINQSFKRMEAVVPGLHEDGNNIDQELTDFATSNGFAPDFLAAMTSPGTLVLPPGAKEAVLLGDGAAGLVEMIYKLYSSNKANDPNTLRAQIKEEVEKELTTTITEQLMKKFKTSGLDTKGFKAIGDVPGGSGEIPGHSGGLTEAQYASMPQAERDKLLGA